MIGSWYSSCVILRGQATSLQSIMGQVCCGIKWSNSTFWRI
jgi:hypothetical protein